MNDPPKLDNSTKSALSAVSVASITTALFRRGFHNTFIGGLTLINPDAQRMVGEAFTLRYIPAREDLDRLDVFRDQSHPQRLAIETIPPGSVLMIDSRQDASAASAGAILLQRLAVRGAAGAVTDGGFRDTPDIARLHFPAYHRQPTAPTNLIKHHAIDINVAIGCGGVAVYPGDVVVGDAEGVVVIPSHLATEVAQDCLEMERFEAFAQEQVSVGRSILGLYPPDDETAAEYEQWIRTRQ
ncbi:MAG: ribonuclease activity regulator RraA [Acidimicrobiia bacterium]|nr:MAG: ribonuclease activity regulator RraA [Acidimicrobiia bacterium]